MRSSCILFSINFINPSLPNQFMNILLDLLKEFPSNDAFMKSHEAVVASYFIRLFLYGKNHVLFFPFISMDNMKGKGQMFPDSPEWFLVEIDLDLGPQVPVIQINLRQHKVLT